MIKKLAILSLIGLVFSKFSSAQTATGCYTANSNSVHTSGPYNGVYANNTGNVYVLPGYCNWTPTTGPTCKVCSGTVITTAGGGSNVGDCVVSLADRSPSPLINGVSGTFTMLRCPLDNDLIGLVLISACAGIFLIRRSASVNAVFQESL